MTTNNPPPSASSYDEQKWTPHPKDSFLSLNSKLDEHKFKKWIIHAESLSKEGKPQASIKICNQILTACFNRVKSGLVLRASFAAELVGWTRSILMQNYIKINDSEKAVELLLAIFSRPARCPCLCSVCVYDETLIQGVDVLMALEKMTTNLLDCSLLELIENTLRLLISRYQQQLEKKDSKEAITKTITQQLQLNLSGQRLKLAKWLCHHSQPHRSLQELAFVYEMRTSVQFPKEYVVEYLTIVVDVCFLLQMHEDALMYLQHIGFCSNNSLTLQQWIRVAFHRMSLEQFDAALVICDTCLKHISTTQKHLEHRQMLGDIHCMRAAIFMQAVGSRRLNPSQSLQLCNLAEQDVNMALAFGYTVSFNILMMQIPHFIKHFRHEFSLSLPSKKDASCSLN